MLAMMVVVMLPDGHVDGYDVKICLRKFQQMCYRGLNNYQYYFLGGSLFKL